MDLLIIAPRYPWPLEKGDKLRLYHHIRELAQFHRIHLFAISHVVVPREVQEQLAPYCSTQTIHVIHRPQLMWNLVRGWLKGLPLSVAYFTDATGLQALRQLVLQVQPDLLYAQLARCGRYLQHISHPAKVIDLMDAFSLIMHQRRRAYPWPLRQFIGWEATRLERYERELVSESQAQVYISDRDRQAIDPQSHGNPVIVPNGIDVAPFTKPATKPPQYDLVFVGNLGYFPNRVAAKKLVREIMPLVWVERPATTLLLAGARPGRDIRKLAEQRVALSGWVPEIRTAYQSGKIFVAPLWQGAGQQNKILEAMACGLPVVTTGHVNTAIQAPEQAIRTATSVATFASEILELLEHPGTAKRIGQEGHTFVSANYHWSTSVAKLNRHAILPYHDSERNETAKTGSH